MITQRQGAANLRHALRRATMLGAAVATACSAAVAVSSGSVASASTSKPDYGYFAGKTITLVANGAAGAAADEVFRAVAGPLGTLLKANVVVEDNPNGAGIAGTDAAAAAPADGLTVGYLNLNQAVSDQVQKVPGIDVPLKKLVLLGGVKGTTSLIVSNAQTGPKTIQQLLSTKTPITVLQEAGSSFSLTVRMLIAAYHAVPVSLQYGYTSSKNLAQGFQRGDGPVTGTALTSLQTYISSGFAIPLMLSRPVSIGVPLYQTLKSVPTPQSLLKTDPPKTKAGVAALKALVGYEDGSNSFMFYPHGTPTKVATAMSAALKSVFAQTAVEAAIVAAGDPSGFISPTQSEQSLQLAVKTEPELAKFLNSNG